MGAEHGTQGGVVVDRMGPMARRALVGTAWRAAADGRARVPADLRRARSLRSRSVGHVPHSCRTRNWYVFSGPAETAYRVLYVRRDMRANVRLFAANMKDWSWV